MVRVPYYNIPQLSYIYLEDSFVLNIRTEANYVELLLELVLTENHPLYQSPLPNEQYFYKKARLIFSEAQQVELTEKINTKYIDANNELDLGNINDFYQYKNYFYLYGDWRELKVRGATLKIEFLS